MSGSQILPTSLLRSQATLGRLKDHKLKTVRAYHLRLTFQEFWTHPVEQAEGFLRLVFLGHTQPLTAHARGGLHH